MRIVAYAEFLKLPAGVIYSEYEPSVCTGLYRKGESIVADGKALDFYASSLVPVCTDDVGAAADPKVDESEGRDGMFDEGQLYAVFEGADLDSLRRILAEAAAA